LRPESGSDRFDDLVHLIGSELRARRQTQDLKGQSFRDEEAALRQLELLSGSLQLVPGLQKYLSHPQQGRTKNQASSDRPREWLLCLVPWTG